MTIYLVPSETFFKVKHLLDSHVFWKEDVKGIISVKMAAPNNYIEQFILQLTPQIVNSSKTNVMKITGNQLKDSLFEAIESFVASNKSKQLPMQSTFVSQLELPDGQKVNVSFLISEVEEREEDSLDVQEDL